MAIGPNVWPENAPEPTAGRCVADQAGFHIGLRELIAHKVLFDALGGAQVAPSGSAAEDWHERHRPSGRKGLAETVPTAPLTSRPAGLWTTSRPSSRG